MRHRENSEMFRFKVVFAGDSGVGKTTLLNRFQTGKFDAYTKATVGLDFTTVKLRTDFGQTVQMMIWDTAGQERYRTICQSYYRDAHAVLFVYDVDDLKTLSRIRTEWNELVNRSANWRDNIVKIMCGNKDDSATGENDGPSSVETSIAEKCHVDKCFRTSAKTGYNVQSALRSLAHILVERKMLLDSYDVAASRRRVSSFIMSVLSLENSQREKAINDDKKITFGVIVPDPDRLRHGQPYQHRFSIPAATEDILVNVVAHSRFSLQEQNHELMRSINSDDSNAESSNGFISSVDIDSQSSSRRSSGNKSEVVTSLPIVLHHDDRPAEQLTVDSHLPITEGQQAVQRRCCPI